MPKITLDVNVLISATLWDRSVSQKVLFYLIDEDYDIFSTLEILAEYKEVLIRDFDYSEEDADKLIQTILKTVTLVKTVSKRDAVKEDPDDNKILECAVDSGSRIILSYDRHLLKMDGFMGIKIMTPDEFRKRFSQSHI